MTSPQPPIGQVPQPPTGQQPFAPVPGAPAQPGLIPGRPWILARKKRVLVLPIVVIVIAALFAAIILLIGLSSVQGWIALLFTTVAAVVIVLILFWIDRWEPEPPLLLIAAFGWGAAIAPLLVQLLNIPRAPLFGGNSWAGSTFAAPLTEETAKGLFFLVVLMSTRRGRAEFNSLTDALVYAGLIGAGFSFIENILYIAGTASAGEALQLSVMRVVLGGFGHMLYTGCVAVGFWLAMRSRGVLPKVAWILAGWIVGMLLHGLHNGATINGSLYFIVLAFNFLVFVTLVVAAIWSSIREGKVVARQLPAMVDHGWIHGADAGWLGTTTGRKSRAKIMKKAVGGDRKRLKEWVEAVTELAYLRERLEKQQGNPEPELVALHQEHVDRILLSKDWVHQVLAAADGGTGGWPPIQGHPGPAYPAPTQPAVAPGGFPPPPGPGGYPPPQAPGGYPPPQAPGYPPPGH